MKRDAPLERALVSDQDIVKTSNLGVSVKIKKHTNTQTHKQMKQTTIELQVHTNCQSGRADYSENRVLNEFAQRLGVTPMQIIQHNKSSDISDIRHLYCKLRHDWHGETYSATGREISRAHATVKYAVRRINDLLAMNDKKIVAMWNRVRDISGLYLLKNGVRSEG